MKARFTTGGGVALVGTLLVPAMALGADALHGLTERYCTSCHNTEDWAGGLDLGSLDPAQVGPDAEIWEKVVLKLRSGMMPPPGKDRPTRVETDTVVRALETRLDSATELHAAAPALHRLNRVEYANAIRDIFGLPVDATTLLPADDSSNGFDNVAAGLGVSPALIQAYTTAAMKLSRMAVGDMTATETTTTYSIPATLAQDQHREGLPLGSRGGMRITHYFPLDAEYRISVRNMGGAVAAAVGSLAAGSPAAGLLAAGRPAAGSLGGGAARVALVRGPRPWT